MPKTGCLLGGDHPTLQTLAQGKELCIMLRELDVRTEAVRTQECAIGNFVTDVMRVPVITLIVHVSTLLCTVTTRSLVTTVFYP